jgi:hypothetical protein
VGKYLLNLLQALEVWRHWHGPRHDELATQI